MIRMLIIFPLVIIGMIFSIGAYLQPDDLKACDGVISSQTPCRPVDAIVAISGGDTNARTDEAIRLYKNGWAKLLIFSGAAEDKTGLSNAAAMRLRALAADVPSAAIYLDEYSETTKQNAENSTALFSKLKINSVILVTSGYHQRRASLEFNKRAEGVTIYNSPVDSDKDWSFWWWTGPRGWSLATSELFKIALFNFGLGQ